MASHPIEALLRPPVELNTGVISIASAGIAALAPEVFMVTPTVAYGGAVALTGYGLWWLQQGLGVIRYQHNLRKAPRFEMSMRELPVSRPARPTRCR